MKALVTGAGGFVGGWLAAHLMEAGDEVIELDPELDVRDGDGLASAITSARPDAIYHLAGYSHVGQSWQEPQAAFEINALGTLNLLQAARSVEPAPRVLLVSSADVYGEVDEASLPLAETAAARPATPYAASKVSAEFLGVQAYLGYGLPVIIVRPFNHIGPGQHESFFFPALARRIVQAIDAGASAIPVGNLAARRDFTDVRDAVRSYRLLIERGLAGEVYNVCSGKDISLAEAARLMLAVAGASLDLEADETLMRPVDLPVLRGDPGKLRAATGWEPAIPLATSLEDLYRRERDTLSGSAAAVTGPGGSA